MSLEKIIEMGKGTMAEAIGIEITEIGDKFVTGKMPVDHRTVQPFGLLHGGASAAFAETLGSIAGTVLVAENGNQAVGININCNHVRSAKSGWVYGKAVPVKIGKKIHVWSIDINDEEGRLVCSSQLTLAVI
ncbi:hotdog fold thioesterase [bacterium]|jgi:1,4-dihydroxy-2-naphthoyl-CoA hydrolase|nr:hotdog fold thioesterase [bacterium]MBT4291218.1 hotdog fold thioesterase [bacterium]MBT7311668.1 hotdog fold thioesterase [bacterium]